ncbi:related to decapping enzyme [Ustilago trichophora]|uniref:Related to decapping enzyme n=1 Tax=Ustilago trichophora TaxID=86804 RepID=A0A5C3E2U1_9BASI|nr:related to decapping enzyme [Ustilago trichophora]
MASIPEARTAFNLKVLRRHDPSIVSIVETASFVVLYNYNGGEWTKTGVEGPLFLFQRRLPPYNGFFLMNRNGVENFSADITPEDDLEITPEFIIYRPATNGDNEVYGIWVFEPSQRMAIGDKMLKLQASVASDNTAPHVNFLT